MSTASILDLESQPRAAKAGWAILLVISGLLMLAGITWFISLPELALENIAERTSPEPAEFMVGEPSAFDVISLIARGYGTAYAALGALSLLVAVEGYRHGARWAWTAMWVLVAAFTGLAVVFMVAAGGVYSFGLAILALAVVGFVGALLARKGLSQ